MKPTRANRTGRYAFTAEEKAKIDAAYQAASGLARRRLEVLRLYAQGETYAYIIKTTAYSETTILKILRRYDEDGLDPICDEPYTGKRKYPATRFEFTAAEIAELKEGCKKPPSRTWRGDLRRCCFAPRGKPWLKLPRRPDSLKPI